MIIGHKVENSEGSTSGEDVGFRDFSFIFNFTF
jgi:hypothetical protein